MKEKIMYKLKNLRLEKKMTRKELAKILGLNPETLKKYENGSILIPMDKLEKIVGFYNSHLYLFFLDLDIENKSTKKDELLELKNTLLQELDKIQDILNK